jgi:hypothetical protein
MVGSSGDTEAACEGKQAARSDGQTAMGALRAPAGLTQIRHPVRGMADRTARCSPLQTDGAR